MGATRLFRGPFIILMGVIGLYMHVDLSEWVLLIGVVVTLRDE